jgi:hypothetical protein
VVGCSCAGVAQLQQDEFAGHDWAVDPRFGQRTLMRSVIVVQKREIEKMYPRKPRSRLTRLSTDVVTMIQ